uniref:DDE-type integrase/transposase/recombinase n=1 Tax=Candidatus Thiodubiliella endoseptemdiera TaxID=2738886 RepID=UPI0034DF6E27
MDYPGFLKRKQAVVAPTKSPLNLILFGYLHVDITELRTDEGKQYLFVAIDRMTKYIYIELYQRMTQDNAVLFLRNLQKDCVFKITHILTDNGIQFTYNLLAKHLRPKDGFLMNCVKHWVLSIEQRSLDIHGLMDRLKLLIKSSKRRPLSAFIMRVLNSLKDT